MPYGFEWGFLFMEEKKLQGIFFKDFSTAYIPEILKELYRERVYAPFFEGNRDMTVVDCGANVGLFSFYAYEFAKKIYAIEPSAQHFDTFSHMIKFNGMENKVVGINKAVSVENGKTRFYHNNNSTMWSLKDTVNKKDDFEEVETISFDTLFETIINEPVIDFLKLDIEGSEGEVIGSQGFQNIAPKIKAMVVELHAWNGFNQSQIFNTLTDYGFKVFPIKAEAMLLGATR